MLQNNLSLCKSIGYSNHPSKKWSLPIFPLDSTKTSQSREDNTTTTLNI